MLFHKKVTKYNGCKLQYKEVINWFEEHTQVNIDSTFKDTQITIVSTFKPRRVPIEYTFNSYQ